MEQRRPRIKLSRNGPYLVTVGDLMNSKGERFDASRGVALCRCGASSRKPFCDSSHIGIGFVDERRSDPAPEAARDSRGTDQPAPSIRIAHNGPYVVCGCDLDIDTWREGASPERYKLCRCGASANKPFCDGSHRRIGFQDDGN